MEKAKQDSLKRMLPKKYRHRRLIACEVSNLLCQYKCLISMMDTYVFNDGSCKNLMCLTGKIPVYCEGVEYDIPVCLWLLENYPLHPPICYLTPTKDMMIVRSKYIDSDGKITFPYLQEWKPPLSDLCGLVEVMKAMFSEEMPLCHQGQGQTAHEPLSREFLTLTESLTQTKINSSVNGGSCFIQSKDDMDFSQLGNQSIC